MPHSWDLTTACGRRTRRWVRLAHSRGVPGPHPIPAELLAAPFTVDGARALGVSHEVLRGSRFRAPFHGVRVPAVLPDSLDLRCRALALLLPDATFSHLTAAQLGGLPVPGRRGALGLPLGEDLEVTVPGKAPRINGVRAHRGRDDPEVLTLGNGLRVTSGGRTWADLAPRLGIDDLIVLGDAVLRGGWADLVQLTAWAARPRRRGAGQMRAAIALLEPRTDSPMETRRDC